FHDLEDTARILERLVPLGRGLHERLDERVERRTCVRADLLGLADTAARRFLRGAVAASSAGAAVAGRLTGLAGVRDAALIADLRSRVLPRRGLVLSDESVVRPFCDARLRLRREPGEHAVEVFGVLVLVADDRRRVRVVDDP